MDTNKIDSPKINNCTSGGSRPSARRPPPLKLLPRVYSNTEISEISEIPENMIEWHGILLPINTVQSPITPSHWSIRILDPLIQHQYRLGIHALISMRVENAMWTDMKPVEFLPNTYLGSYYDIYNFEHSVRVSVLDDFSLINLIADDELKPIAKLEVHARDDGDTNIMAHFDKVRDFLDSQSGNSIKFIHCVAGMNRSATLATAYYMYKTKCPLLTALQYMVALRPIILRNDNFLMQLVVWAYDNRFI